MKRKHTIRNEKRLTLGVLFLIYYLATLAIAIPARVCAGEETIATVSTTYHQRQNQYDSSAAKECVSSSIRGGGDGAYDDDDEATIRRFLQDPNNKISLDQFHVHGWRWHTMSLVREAKRLEKMADRYHDDNINNLGEKCCNSLKQATEYVVGFNLKGLHKIEADLFFPWMRNKLTTSSMIQAAAAATTTTTTTTTTTDLVNAFGSIMDHLERDRQKVAKLGESIVSSHKTEAQLKEKHKQNSTISHIFYPLSLSLLLLGSNKELNWCVMNHWIHPPEPMQSKALLLTRHL